MSGLLLILVGIVLVLAGARSLRTVVLAAGFGVSWLVADAAGASVLTGLLVGAAGAVAGLVAMVVVASAVTFVVGALVGAAIGGKLFALLHTGDGGLLLGLLFVAAFAVVAGFLAQRFRRRFLIWATAAAGAGLVLSGLAELNQGTLGLFRHPEDPGESVVVTIAWVALVLAGRAAQVRVGSADDEDARR